MAHYGDRVGYPPDLPDLMGNYEDSPASLPQPPQGPKEGVHLAVREEGRGLVEDQDRGTPPEELEDLKLLELALGEAPGPSPGIQAKGVGLDEGGHLGLSLAAGEDKAQAPGLGAEDDILSHGKIRDIFRMLLDHANAQAGRGGGVGDGHLDSAYPDGAGVGLLEAIEDLHEGRFPGAVLTHDGVDLEVSDLEAGAVIGEDVARRIEFGDGLHHDAGHAWA